MIDPSEATTLALPGVLLPMLHRETANLADKHSVCWVEPGDLSNLRQGPQQPV